MLTITNLDGFEATGKHKKKKQIILCHTSRNLNDYISSLKYRYNGNNKQLPHYIISNSGEVFSIIKPDTYSNFLENEKVNKNAIVICLENLGWLKKNPLSNYYVNWIGNIYNQGIYEKKWRGHFFWARYTDEQIKSLGILVNQLCDEFDIPKSSIGHNVKVDGIEKFEGIVTKSNFDADFTDLNPHFDFETFKMLLDND